MKSLVVLFFIPSALLRDNAESFLNAESTSGGVIWGRASERKRIQSKDERPDKSLGKCHTTHDPTATTDRASSKRRRQPKGVSQANYAKVKAEQLKETIKEKIKRTCGEQMGFLFIPYSYIYVTTKESPAGAFKMLPYIEENVLPLTWKVYLPGEPLTASKEGELREKPTRIKEDEANPPMEEDNQSEESPEEKQLRNSIDRVLSGIYKVAEDGRKVLITEEEMDNSLKEELIKYCQLLKKVDTSGTLEEHEMGSEMVVFDNLVKLLQKHRDETVFTLRRKLRNPALCMKNVGDWVLNRRGLVLPDSSCSKESEQDTNLGVESKWMQFVKSNYRDENTDWYDGEGDGMVNLAKLEMRSEDLWGTL
uniref:Phy-TSERA1 protein n=1 Tax=Plasmodium hylobati TaxID=77520 RepID=F1SYZ2_PLAHY|nr:Phy-TSERA1 [Plasmodium hylobati]